MPHLHCGLVIGMRANPEAGWLHAGAPRSTLNIRQGCKGLPVAKIAFCAPFLSDEKSVMTLTLKVKVIKRVFLEEEVNKPEFNSGKPFLPSLMFASTWSTFQIFPTVAGVIAGGLDSNPHPWNDDVRESLLKGKDQYSVQLTPLY
jgi:hypothetical protein